LAYSGEREDSASRFQLKVDGKLSLGLDEESEPATDKGVIALSMRHLESKERMAMRMLEQLMSERTAENAQLRAQLTAAFNQQLEGFKLVQELMDRREDRALRHTHESNSENFRMSVLKKVDLLLPMVGAKFLPESGLEKLQIASFFESLQEPQINAIVGMLKTDQTTTLFRIIMTKGQDSKQIAKWLTDLSEEQFMKLASVLSPEQMGTLNDYWETMQKKAEKETKEAETEAVKEKYAGSQTHGNGSAQ
jgi:hypothetical protein